MTGHGYSEKQFVNVAVDKLALGPNIRRDAGDLDTLVESIRKIGILEPVLCCPTEDGEGVEVLCGQRRTIAARQAGLKVVPCIIRPRPTEAERVFLQLVENAERKDMSPVEHGDTFLALRDAGYTQQQIATALGRSMTFVRQRAAVAQRAEFYRDAVHRGVMSLNFALDIPAHLAADPVFTGRLEKIAHLGEQRMRDFVAAKVSKDREGQAAASRVQGGSELTQQFACRITHDVLQVIKAEARRRHISIPLFVEQAILAYAREGIAA